jgi:hypothetical protein
MMGSARNSLLSFQIEQDNRILKTCRLPISCVFFVFGFEFLCTVLNQFPGFHDKRFAHFLPICLILGINSMLISLDEINEKEYKTGGYYSQSFYHPHF